MKELFGDVKDGTMVLNNVGLTAHQMWMEIPRHHKCVELDEFQIMPNHVHGILIITGKSGSDVARNVATGETNPRNVATEETNPRNVATTGTNQQMSAISPRTGSLGTIVRSYKSAVSNWCHANSYPNFSWQARYHDHIIRYDNELNHVREYIRNNPARWNEDRNHSSGSGKWQA